MTDNGKQKAVDFKNPVEVIALLRQRGASLATLAASLNSDELVLGEIADAVAILMFVTAQGMERSVQPLVRPVSKPPVRLV